MTLKMRTPEEMKAYVEGYNACNEMFRKYLKQERKSVENVIKTMDVLVAAVNGVMGWEAIEALEQQPCDDCISRQEAINCVTLNEFRYKIVEDMKTLPSVAPKEKTGHWKPIEYDGYADGYPVWDVWECSKCGGEHNGDKESLTAFCPDCGAKMIEPQESEDNE